MSWGPPCTRDVALVPHAVGAVGVVALSDLADPLRGIARHACHGGRRHVASQQPEEVLMTALDRIICAAGVGMKFVVS